MTWGISVLALKGKLINRPREIMIEILIFFIFGSAIYAPNFVPNTDPSNRVVMTDCLQHSIKKTCGEPFLGVFHNYTGATCEL